MSYSARRLVIVHAITVWLPLLGLPLLCEPVLAQSVSPVTRSSPQIRAIVLGQPEETPYVVVIPGSDFSLLHQVQQYAPLAFLSNSRLGSYIQAGAYTDRSPAEVLSRALQQQGWDARVVYMPIR